MSQNDRAVRHRLLIGTYVALLCALTAVGARAAQDAAPPPRTLQIGGDVARPLTLRPVDLQDMTRTRVEVKDVDRKVVRYEGVLVAELLKRAGATLGDDLRGDALASYVVATGADGYRAVFSLAELDPEFTGSAVLVADAVDGKPLLASQGPLRIIAPGDAREARSVRMLERLDVVRLKE